MIKGAIHLFLSQKCSHMTKVESCHRASRLFRVERSKMNDIYDDWQYKYVRSEKVEFKEQHKS